MKRAQGFTLIELVVAMVLASIVVGFTSLFLTTPVNAYMAQTRRAALSDSAETALRHLSRDVGRALPNSIRLSTLGARRVVEMIDVEGAAFYRDLALTPAEGEALTPGVIEAQFDLLQSAPPPAFTRAVINNQGLDAYLAIGVSQRSASAAPNGAINTRIDLHPNHTFPDHSPNRRVYLVTAVTRYECDPTAGTLRRWRNQPITAATPLNGVGASDLLAQDVSACTFAFGSTPPPPLPNPPPQHGGVLTIDMTIARAADGNLEQLRVFRQIEVQNAP